MAMNTASTPTPTRLSQETEHRHLLASSSTPSAATSVIHFGSGTTTPRNLSPSGTRTPRAVSPSRTQQHEQPYKGFPSEAAYLDALRQWAEGKKVMETKTGLEGFYGGVTTEEYARRPRLELGLRRRWRERKDRGHGKGVST